MKCVNCRFFDNEVCYIDPPVVLCVVEKDNYGGDRMTIVYERPLVAKTDIACKGWRKA